MARTSSPPVPPAFGGLSQRIATSMIAVCGIALLVSWLALIPVYVRNATLVVEQEAGVVLDLLVANLEPNLAVSTPDALVAQLSSVSAFPNVTEAKVTGLRGEILAEFAAPLERSQLPAMLEPLVMSRMLIDAAGPAAELEVTVSLHTVTMSVAERLAVSFLVSVAALILSVLMARRLAQRIARPVRRLERGMRAVSDTNDLSKRVDAETGADEFQTLIDSFNAMLGELEARDARLQDVVEDLRQARDAAEHATRVKSQFLASVSHEIRTPLNGVVGMIQVLSARDFSDDVREMLDTIDDCGKTLTMLLNDVLDLSKIEAGRLDITPVDGDLKGALNGVHRLFTSRAQEKGLSLSLQYAPDLPERMRFDPVRIRQCVSNLISNAIKFTETGSVSVTVRAEPDGEERGVVSIAVTDTGIGIDLDAQRQIFDAFTQADGATTRNFGGTGLGLTISKRLAEMMGGDIRLTSQVGRGSTFTFSFAAEYVAGAARGPSDHAADATAHRTGDFDGSRVLLVDDNIVNRRVARVFLEPLGFDITEAENGQEAIDILDGSPFDLLLIDMHMPVMDGPTAVKTIRSTPSAYQSMPIIALTADAMIGDRERYLAMGMDGYTSKPIDKQALRSEIATALGRAGAARHRNAAGSS